MSGSFSTSPVGRGARPDAGRGVIAGVRQVIEQLRSPADLPDAARGDRVDVRDAVLSVLAERPASGYEIVRVLESRSTAPRSPGAGAVYPMLQMLADEGLASATEADGRKLYSLTDAGRVAAEAVGARRTPDDRPGRRPPVRRGGLTRASAQLVQTAALVGQTGTPEQVADSVAALDEARRRLLSILTRD